MRELEALHGPTYYYLRQLEELGYVSRPFGFYSGYVHRDYIEKVKPKQIRKRKDAE